MGELTDAIKKTLASLENEPEVEDIPATDDEVKQAMANLGMKIDGYTKQEKEDTKPFMNPPVEKTKKKTEKVVPKKNESDETAPEPIEESSTTSEQPTEVYCKISNGNMVIMFPADICLKEINVSGETLKTLTFEVPDMDNPKLQVLPIAVEQPKTIKRVPIKLTYEEKVAWGLIEEKPKKSESTKVEVSDDLEELREQKKEIDLAIKEARKAGDLDLVEELRKQRHKIRNKINKMEE